MSEVEKLRKEIKKLKSAFTRLDNYYEAKRVNSHYNNANVVKVGKKPVKWW